MEFGQGPGREGRKCPGPLPFQFILSTSLLFVVFYSILFYFFL